MDVCDQVQGVIFAISPEQLVMLDRHEEEERGYRREMRIYDKML